MKVDFTDTSFIGHVGSQSCFIAMQGIDLHRAQFGA